MTKAKANRKANARLKAAAEFIRELNSKPKNSVPPAEGWSGFISKTGEGSILFSREYSLKYSDTVASLIEAYGKDERLSPRAAEKVLHNAIFLALDLQSQSSQPFEDRLNEALATIDRVLSKSPQPYICCLPVRGFEQEGFTGTFGDVQLGLLSQRLLQKLSKPDVRGIEGSFEYVNATGQTHFAVRVEARDVEAALLLAQREARRVLDVLNFFFRLIPSNSGWGYFPEEAAVANTETLSFAPDTGWTPHLKTCGPFPPLALRSVRDQKPLVKLLRQVRQLFGQRDRSGLADTILTAIQWAGRANVEPVREKKFLLYSIALETIILPAKDQELGYRLRTRIARLISRDPSTRKELVQLISKLYETRSKIVHSGSYEVSETDLVQLRSIVRAVIFKLLSDSSVKKLKTPKELNEWFESKALS